MIRRPPRSTRTDTLFPYTTLIRSEIKTTSYSYSDGARAGGYKESAATPVLGIVVKPVPGLSLYANRIDGLVAGPMAPPTSDDDGLPATPPQIGRASCRERVCQTV